MGCGDGGGNKISDGQGRQVELPGDGEGEGVGPDPAGDFPAAGGAAAGAQGAGSDGLEDERGVAADQGGEVAGNDCGAAFRPHNFCGGQFLEGIWQAALRVTKAILVNGRIERLRAVRQQLDKAAEFRNCEPEARASPAQIALGYPVAEGLGGDAEQAGGAAQGQPGPGAEGDLCKDFVSSALDVPCGRAAFPREAWFAHGWRLVKAFGSGRALLIAGDVLAAPRGKFREFFPARHGEVLQENLGRGQ